jgi:superfamily II DNA/RNA helicase
LPSQNLPRVFFRLLILCTTIRNWNCSSPCFLGKDMKSVLVFSSTKINVKTIAKDFKKAGLSVAAIHSDLEQKERETVLSDYRNRKFQVLVATDILSRGIDIDGIDLVVNYDVPPDAEDYIHRVGALPGPKLPV